MMPVDQTNLSVMSATVRLLEDLGLIGDWIRCGKLFGITRTSSESPDVVYTDATGMNIVVHFVSKTLPDSCLGWKSVPVFNFVKNLTSTSDNFVRQGKFTINAGTLKTFGLASCTGMAVRINDDRVLMAHVDAHTNMSLIRDALRSMIDRGDVLHGADICSGNLGSTLTTKMAEDVFRSLGIPFTSGVSVELSTYQSDPKSYMA